MPHFIYKAVQSNGTLLEGKIEAPDRKEAISLLEARGFQPIRINEVSESRPEEQSTFRFWVRRGVPAAQLEEFTRALASLLSAGVSLSRALSLLASETSHPVAREKWKELHQLVIDGMSLADAMARFPDVFPRVYIAMVEAGETGGFLELVLNQIADFQARERDFKARVTPVLIYPAVLFVLAIGVLVFLLTFFIPRFQTMFEGFEASLPWITQLIVQSSHVIRTYGLYGLAVCIAGLITFARWVQTEQGRRAWEQRMLKLPFIGPIAGRLALTRFFRMLGTLLAAGVPLIQALNVARRSLGYQILTDAVYDAVERVRRGESLASSLADCHELFSRSTLEMIRVAEESGQLDKELVRLADVYEKDVDQKLNLTVRLAEPILLFFIAGFIGTIFIGMVLPIFTIQDYIR